MTRLNRIHLATAAAGLLLLGIATALWVQTQAQTTPVTASSPISVGGAGPEAIIQARSSPALAADPFDSRHLVLAQRIDRPRFDCMVHVSTDAGATWRAARVPLPAGIDNCFLPDVTFAGRTVLLVYLTLNTHPKDPLSGGNDPNGMYLLRSEDGGFSFGPPLALPGKDNLQPRVVSDRQGTVVHVVYVQGTRLQNDTPLGLGPPPNPIVVISSMDGGRSFGQPVQVNDPKRRRVVSPVPILTEAGKLLVLYQDLKGDLDDYNNKAEEYRGTSALVLASSSDRGHSFRQLLVDDAVVRPHRFLVYLPPSPAFAAGPDGRLYVAWSDGRGGAPDVLYRSSDDGGRSWNAPLTLSYRDRGQPANFELPALAARAGHVEAVFLAIAGRKPYGHYEYAISVDGGHRFQRPARVSRDFDASVGAPSPRNIGSVDFGTRSALVVIDQHSTLVAWSDSSKGTADTGRQDVMVVRLTVR